jgi:DNA-binding CsgD family transcriptional regulator
VLAETQRACLVPEGDTRLTPAELRIAELVASGHGNPEITATLYIRAETVEANLTCIYRKLGPRSRVDLTRRGGPLFSACGGPLFLAFGRARWCGYRAASAGSPGPGVFLRP